MRPIGIDPCLIDQAQRQRHHMAQLGRAGGKATARRHGRIHMAEIGRAGFNATLARHWQGDRRGMLAWLREQARFAVADALADLEIARQLDGGKSIACCELPY